MHADLRNATFEEWVDFVFDHPVPESPSYAGFAASDDDDDDDDGDPGDGDEWYWDDDLAVEVTPALQVRYMTRLFREPELLLERFSEAQVEQGFWFISGPGGEEHFRDYLWDPDVSWIDRRACILATCSLYERLFTKADLETIPFMFWDCLAHEYEFGFRTPSHDAEDARVQDAMFEALSRILRQDDDVAVHAALHGLFHLAHRGGPALIRAFLAERPDLDEETVEYAHQVLRGEAM